MANISLDASIRTCKIDTAYADKVYSDRFMNPANMVCPIWNGYDSTGRPVCPDSFMTKNPGCASALDRINVENTQRPQYVEYVNLSAGGISGEIYGENPGYPMNQWATMKRKQDLYNLNTITGNFGQQFGSSVNPSCGVEQYNKGLAQDATSLRKFTAVNRGHESNYYKNTC